jgi:D-alanyl-D-alanine dipeptidase
MTSSFSVPIPSDQTIDGWQEVPIAPLEEPFVTLNDLEETRICVEPAYFLMKIHGSMPECYARESVAKRLLSAAEQLPKDYKLKIWDAWRPLEVQSALFEQYLGVLRDKYPLLDEDALMKKAERFVSLPSSDALKPSPHYTGGAVDLTIVGPDGKELDMGTPFDYFGEEAHTAYYEEKLTAGTLLPTETEILNNRRLLFHAMTIAGFSNYPFEWWHFDYGNQFWGRITCQAAFYTGQVPNNHLNKNHV